MIRSLARARADRRNEVGRELLDAGDVDGAGAAFEDAVRLDPANRDAWFNLGLVHKQRRDWLHALRCNRTALAIGTPLAGDPAWWNLGIAATALRDWATARAAWRGYGVDVPDGHGELDMQLGPIPIRVSPDHEPEVVWCARIDPARAVVTNVPLDSRRRWHDVLLHDGDPAGWRDLDGRDLPVFDELEVWQSSRVPTFLVEVVADEAATGDLSDAAAAAGYAAEDWTASVHVMCAECSLGNAPAHRHGDADDAARRERRVGVAAPAEVVRTLLASWARRHDVTYGEPVRV